MAPAFSKEAILQGSIDHLCLVCECYLRSEREVCLHVATPTHSHNLDRTEYVEKYKHDRIRKVKKWYFCELCNVLVTTITKVRLHVEDSKHKENMVSQMVTRVGNVIVSGDKVIQDEAWHGIIDENTCVICNEEFEDKDDHRSETNHIINLTLSRVSCDGNNIYRKIDDSTFHCLTCNTVVAQISAHLDGTKHKTLLQNSPNIKSLKSEKGSKKENTAGECSRQSRNDIFIEAKKNLANKIASDRSEITNKPKNKTSMYVKPDVNIDELMNTLFDTKHYITYDPNGKLSCNLCNCEIDPLAVQLHLDDQHHQKMLKMYNSCTTNKVKDKKMHTSDILDSILKYQKGNVDINLETCTAVCRKCSVNIEYDPQAIESHIDKHKNNAQEKNSGTQSAFEIDDKSDTRASGTLFPNPIFQNIPSENNKKTKPTETDQQNIDIIQKTAEEHGLTYVPHGKKVYCEICSKHIPSAVSNIEQHVNGELHRNNVVSSSRPSHLKNSDNRRANTKKNSLQRVPIHQFVRTMTTIKNMFGEDVIINEKYCINVLAFAFFSVSGPKQLKCQICELNLSLQHIDEHLSIEGHKRALDEVPVVIHTDSEFIREIRSDLFQCGYCNIVDSWESMEKHLKSADHKESKTFASWRLSQYLPQIEQHRSERDIHNEFFMRLMFC